MLAMGPVIRAVFSALLALPTLLPRSAGAQAQPPAAAFPDPATKPANAEPANADPAPANAEPAPAPASSAPPPAQAPPPVAYPAPYPPPPGYPYGYYYAAPPIVPLPPPPSRYADDAAVSSTPFFDAIIVAADWRNRISESASIGAQAGVFVARRVRLTAKISFPTEGSGDLQTDFESGSKSASFFYAFSAGFAALRTPTFAMSPGLMFARTDVSDYGTMLGLSLPLDWVTKGGLRLGLEGGLGPAFGGRRVTCTGTSANCSQQPRYEDRVTGAAAWLQFHIGFGLNHPGPLPPDVPPTAGVTR